MPKVAPQVAERGSNPSKGFLLPPESDPCGGKGWWGPGSCRAATCCKDPDVGVLAAFCGAELG